MRSRSPSRLLLVHVMVALLFLTLLGRLWQVQITDGRRYAGVAAADHVRHIAIPPVRGRVVDDRGRPLVRNRTAMTVAVDRAALRRLPGGGKSVLRRLAKTLDRPYREIADRVRLCGPGVEGPCWAGSPYQPIPVAEGVDERVATQILERPEAFPAVTAEPQPVRDHPYGRLAAHVLGYVAPGDGDHPSGLTLVGKDGLEAAYEEELRGTPGRREVVVDSEGQVLRTVREQQPTAGATLVTSLNADVQRVVERALERAARKAESGAAVVLDAREGRVVAMASYPGYDPGVWTGGIAESAYRRLTGGNAPLMSRALQGQWPPASTWKIVSTAAAAEDGYDPRGSYDCSGSYRIGDREFRNFRGVNHGPMNLHRALVVSCDTIFYRFAHQMWQRGTEPMQEMARAFGFGAPTGIDLPGEPAGRVPDKAWKRKFWEQTKADTCRAARKGYPRVAETDPARAAYLKAIAKENCARGYVYGAGDAANFSIGQGDVLVTPLQLARAYAALANGGTLFSPRVGKEVRGPDGRVLRTIEPPEAGRLPVAKKTLAYMRDALAEVPRSGTAAGAFAGFPFGKLAVAGKTGTAEAFGETDTSWFASYAPADDPRYVVVVVVSEGGAGGEAAAPAVREIWSGMYGLEGKKAALPKEKRF